MFRTLSALMWEIGVSVILRAKVAGMTMSGMFVVYCWDYNRVSNVGDGDDQTYCNRDSCRQRCVFRYFNHSFAEYVGGNNSQFVLAANEFLDSMALEPIFTIRPSELYREPTFLRSTNHTLINQNTVPEFSTQYLDCS